MRIVPEIKDSYAINSGVFYLLGIVIAVPFSFYINSMDFWMYKFTPPSGPPRPHPPGPGPPKPGPPKPGPPRPDPPRPDPRGPPFIIVIENSVQPGLPGPQQIKFEPNNILLNEKYSTKKSKKDFGKYFNDSTPPDERTPIQTNFTSSFNITNKVALLGALLICLFLSHKLPPPEERLKGCLIALCVTFSLNILLTQIDPKQMISLFFGITLLLSTILNFCVGLATATLYELMSKFPPTYYASIQSGGTVCAVVSGVVQVSLIPANLRPNMGGIVYFTTGTIILIATTVYYCFKVKDSKYFIYKISQSEQHRKYSRIQSSFWLSKKAMSHLIYKIKWYYATLIFTEGASHIVYPGLMVLVAPANLDEGDKIWKYLYFVPVTIFLGFPICNLIGREVARIIKIPKSGIVLFVIAALRIFLIPLFIFCNVQPRDHLPVLFEDRVFVCLVIILGFSEGVLMNLSVVAIPTILDKDDREAVMVLVPLVSAITVTLASGLSMFVTNLL